MPYISVHRNGIDEGALPAETDGLDAVHQRQRELAAGIGAARFRDIDFLVVDLEGSLFGDAGQGEGACTGRAGKRKLTAESHDKILFVLVGVVALLHAAQKCAAVLG
ncbi:hypothetical protein [Sinorhizobium medicae]|uniref:hypothetical protein n=1 Tax=Sinorhizobium medicae TaxID=110321 RepID=UPI001F2AC696|nr:hypothetical protein [Sinorhizobium medicae]